MESSGAGRGEEGASSTEDLLRGLVETFREGCVILETPSENRETNLTKTINMAIAQMQKLAEQSRLTDSDGMYYTVY